MKVVPLGELMPSRIPTINPGAFPGEQFTLWSIPSYDAGKPEHVVGRDVGSSKKTVQDGDVLLSKIVPHIRRAWKVSVSNGHRQIASSEWITFRHDAFLSDYIRHFLLTDQFHRQFMDTVAGVGGSLLRAQPKSVAKIVIPLPPLEEQRRIVGLLDRAAEIRRRADAARSRARAIIPALFLDTFGDPATNPKGWPIRTLGEVAFVGSGAGFPKQFQGRQDQEFPFLKVSDMNLPGNELCITSWNNTVSEAKRRKLRAMAFKAGSVIFPKIGAAIATNKKRILTVPSCVDNNVMAVRFGDQVVDAFGLALFQSKNISDFASASDPPSMRKTTVEQWAIPLPPLPLQKTFAEQAQRLESLARALDAACAKAEAMAAALSAEMFGQGQAYRRHQPRLRGASGGASATMVG